MTRTFERRAFPLSDIKIRAANDKTGKLHFSGRAVVYGQMSDDLGGWQEIVQPGAGTRTLAAKPDCRFLINHDPNLLLARTLSGTATLAEVDEGVDVEADMADVTYARDLAVLLERGDISQMSFGFWIVRDNWSGNLHQLLEYDIDGGDVSVVTFPAYPQTSAELREQARRHGARPEQDSGGVGPGSVEPDLVTVLRSLSDVSPEAALLALRAAGDGSSVLSGHSRQLVQDAVDNLASLLLITEPADGYPLERAKHRLRELELLASL
ncbi:MAG: HK97 family phage prohead protease [Jatrophihabitantaceae bacterium]